MKIRIFTTLLVLLYLNGKLVAQELLLSKNSTEYMCAPIETISDFDSSNEFVIGDNDFLIDGQNHIEATAKVVQEGLQNSNCLELQNTTFTLWGGTYFLKCNKNVTLNEKEGIGVWLKSTRDVLSYFYFEDASGTVFSVPKKYIEGNTGWSYTYALPDSYRQTNTSPKVANPAISYPCKFLGYSFFPRDENTVIYVDDFKKVKELDNKLDPSISVSPKKVANVYSVNETVDVTVNSIANKLKIQIRNYKGEVLDEKLGDESLSLLLPTDNQGYFELLILSYQDEIVDEKLINGKVFSYAVTRDNLVYNERLGVCAHPQRTYYHEESVDLMSILGSKYMKIGMVLEFMENDDGSYSLNENTINILDDAKERGLKFVCIFRDKIPPLTDELKTRFLNYGRFLLDEYKNVIDKVELWNEWTNGTGTYTQYQSQQTVENYADFISSIYPVLKAEYPDVEFIGLGGENPQRFRDHIVEMFEAGVGQHMDAMSLHPYRQPVTPGSKIRSVHDMTMAEQILDIVEISKSHNGPEKVYITEIGYPTHLQNIGLTEFTQAQYIVKTLGLLLTSNVVEQVDWYNLYDMNEISSSSTFKKDEEYSQLHFGLFNGKNNNFAIKPGAMSYRFFANITDGFGEGSQFDTDGFFKLTMLGKYGGELEIVWDEFKETQYRIDEGNLVYDLMGNLIDHDGTIVVAKEPVYILKSKLNYSAEFHESKDFKIFPNPVDEALKISFQSFLYTSNSIVQLSTFTGEKIQEFKLTSSLTTIPFESYLPGVYILTLKTDKGVASMKVVKK